MSHCSSISVLLLVLVFLVTDGSSLTPRARTSSGSPPAMRAIITSHAFDYLSDMWLPILKDKLTQLETKDITGKFDISIAKLNYNLSNLSVEKLDVQKSSIRSQPHIGLNLTLDNATILASLDWKISLENDFDAKLQSIWNSFKSFLKKPVKRLKSGLLNLILPDNVPFQGSVRISAKNMTLHTGMFVNASDVGGLPRVNMTNCFLHIESFDLKFKGDGSNFLDKLVGHFKDLLKGKLSNLVCDKLRELLQQLDQYMPGVVDIGDVAGLDLTLSDEPSFSERAVQADLRGDFRSTTQPNIELPNHSAPLPPPPPSWTGPKGKMVYLMATDYVANTAAQVYMRAGKFRYDVMADSVKSTNPFVRLDTTTFSLVAPELFHRFGNRSLMLTVRATRQLPSIRFTEGGASFSVLVAVDVYVVCNESSAAEDREEDPICKGGNMPLALTLEISAETNAVFWLGYNSTEYNDTLSITGNATHLKLGQDVNVTKSNIGKVDLRRIFKLANALKLVETEALPRINKWANKGYRVPNPLVKRLTFDNPELQFYKGYATVGLDISYQV